MTTVGMGTPCGAVAVGGRSGRGRSRVAQLRRLPWVRSVTPSRRGDLVTGSDRTVKVSSFFLADREPSGFCGLMATNPMPLAAEQSGPGRPGRRVAPDYSTGTRRHGTALSTAVFPARTADNVSEHLHVKEFRVRQRVAGFGAPVGIPAVPKPCLLGAECRAGASSGFRPSDSSWHWQRDQRWSDRAGICMVVINRPFRGVGPETQRLPARAR